MLHNLNGAGHYNGDDQGVEHHRGPDRIELPVTGQFAGTLNPTPAYPTQGNIGLNNTFDLMCTSAYDCLGARPTIGTYISGYAGQLQWWGWQYVTSGHGIWVNSQDGNTGDITG